MPGQGNRGTISALLLGGIGLLSVSALVYYFFFFKSPLAITNKPVIVAAPSKEQQEVEVDDEADEEDEDADDVDETAAKLKEQYDAANKLATKYVKGGTPGAYQKAIEKLTEALNLAPQIPGASKDISTLYNNRSAMFEKMSQFDKSLSDITVVLAMDKFHQKARVRRARINEAQGKLKLALADYAFVSMMQQHKGQAPEFGHKMEELVKTLAKKDTPSSLEQLRATAGAGADRPLPSKAHCRNFFEAYPTFYSWKEFYQTVSLEKLQNAVKELAASQSAAAPVVTTAARLDVVCWCIVNNKFSEAFKELESVAMPDCASQPSEIAQIPDGTTSIEIIAPYLESTITSPKKLSSLICELKAAELHLKCYINEATAAYKQALSHYPENIDARLKIANILAENGQAAEAMTIHDDLSNFCSMHSVASTSFDEATAGVESKGDEADKNDVVNVSVLTTSLLQAWSLLHRAAIHLTRDDSGKYIDGAVTLAMEDIDMVLELTDGIEDSLAMKAARLNALIRSVYVLSQSKPMVGEQTTEEDVARNASSIAEAKSLFPDHDALLLMEAELLSQDGKWDEAEALIKLAQSLPSAIPGDCTPVFVSASLLTSKAMMMMMSGMAPVEECKKMFHQSDEYYKQALMMEPNAIEVLSQYAQYKSTMGAYTDAVEMLRDALKLARTRDDVMDLMQLLYANEAHDSAAKEIMGGDSA